MILKKNLKNLKKQNYEKKINKKQILFEIFNFLKIYKIF